MTVSTNLPDEQNHRLNEAAKRLEDIQKRIAPFIKPRVIVNKTTQGQWKRASSEDIILNQQGFFGIPAKNIHPPEREEEKTS